jgi:hypothetical protein
MTPDDRKPMDERLFEGLEPPAPPPQLRSRVLAAARELKTEKLDLWTRIWNQPGLRLVWAAAVVLLLAGHVLFVPGNGVSFDLVDPGLVAENRLDEHFVDLLRPIRISEDAKPIVGLFALAGDPTNLDAKGNPS